MTAATHPAIPVGPALAVVSPHRDDAALSLAATLDALADRGVAVTVVSCFTHSAWAPRLAGERAPAETVSRIREQEDAAFLGGLGRGSRLVSLGLSDAPLRRPAAASVFTAVAELDAPAEEELSRQLPGATAAAAVAAPLALGGHVDHQIACRAVLAACRDRPLAWYEDLPYAFALSRREIAARVAAVQALCGRRLVPLRLPHPRPLAVWRQSAAPYGSQFTASEIDEMLDVQRTWGGERLWVTAAFADWLRGAAPAAAVSAGP
jgi:LmbE family N-acetylglucosaminyl deacetylase